MENNNLDNKLKLSQIALANSNGEEALKYSSEILEADPDNARAWLIKGTATVYTAKGLDIHLRYPEALFSFEMAEKLNPSLEREIEKRRAEARDMVVNHYTSIGNNHWDHAVKMANIRGSYADSGEFPANAIVEYEKGLEIEPNNEILLKNVIHVYKEIGRVELAEPYIQRMRQRNSSYVAPTNVAPTNRKQTISGTGSDDFMVIIYAIVALLGAVLFFITILKK